MSAGLDVTAARCAGLAGGVDHVLLAGMGGSSLFPEVVARSGGTDPAAPVLHVLDTTDPAAIARLGRELPPQRTLHVAASKSGSTLETRSHLAWAWERHPDPARFAVITDPGSDLAALAADRGFAATFENRPDIGGRYSALSYFGIVPALLAGADVADLLDSAARMADRLRASAAANPGARLAAAVAAGVRAGRDKLTIVAPDEQATFGLWLEQLLAESTGKDGTGVVPVVGEPLAGPEAYGDDRMFVALGDDTHPAALGALADAGHPVVVLPFDGGFAGLGAQVLLWEMATALAGALLDIQPFDQPDVAAAKAATAKVLDQGPPTVDETPLDDLLSLSARATTWPSRPSSTPAARGRPDRAGPGGAARPSARGDDRGPRPAVPALDRPAPQGRPEHRRVRAGGGRPRRRGRRHPGRALRVRHARAGAGRRRPADAARTRAAGRGPSWEVAS